TIGIVDGAGNYLTLDDASTSPTASSATFHTSLDTKPADGQIYRFSPPPNCSMVSGFPTSATTEVFPTSVCISGSVTLSITPNASMPVTTGLVYSWQSAPAATGPWTT